METLMKTIGTKTVVQAKAAIREVKDSGRVQMGAVSPSFPPVRATPVNEVKDSGRVQMGAVSPSFPPVRATS
jgi:hypothetical protein